MKKGDIVKLKDKFVVDENGYSLERYAEKTGKVYYIYTTRNEIQVKFGSSYINVRTEDLEIVPRVCKVCGCVEDEHNELKYIDEYGFICEECIEDVDEIKECEECGEYVLVDRLIKAYTNRLNARGYWRTEAIYICQDCADETYETCECCEELWKRDEMSETRNGYVCNSCADEYYHECEECGTLYHQDDMEYDDEEEAWYCDNCYREREPAEIKSYSYKPSPVFKTKEGRTLYYESDSEDIMLGAELEIDKGYDARKTAKEIMEDSEDIYIKHDGSLSSSGMEIVTHPCELEYHLNGLGWDDICRTARRHDYLSQDAKTCGLHIHVGRHNLGGNKTVANVLLLVDRHWDKLVKFSRRTESKLSEWAERPSIYYDCDETELEDRALRTVNDGRYQAVNLCNYRTIEFRLWNGTLIASTIKATLEMTKNICEYAKEHTLDECLASQWHEITGFKKYEELEAYIKERKLDDEEYLEPTKYGAELAASLPY